MAESVVGRGEKETRKVRTKMLRPRDRARGKWIRQCAGSRLWSFPVLCTFSVQTLQSLGEMSLVGYKVRE